MMRGIDCGAAMKSPGTVPVARQYAGSAHVTSGEAKIGIGTRFCPCSEQI